jgi:hypothetical protein
MSETTMKTTKTVEFGAHEAEVHHLVFPASEFHQPFVAIASTELQTGDFAADTAPLMPFVKSWTVNGDPHDLAAWRELDYFKEYLPLRREIMGIVNDRIGQSDLKN